jgi:hypothetical protein
MNATTTRSGGGPQPAAGRPYLGIYFECCHVYARVYRRPDRNAYVARCPRCLRAARIRVGPDGSQKKFFTAH